jgi:hypothetical protein
VVRSEAFSNSAELFVNVAFLEALQTRKRTLIGLMLGYISSLFVENPGPSRKMRLDMQSRLLQHHYPMAKN